ncbi:hypothetical protein K505DRAFT_365296 [Melanomma pulvis-pyrius CBS 109.77]|uniref:Uncharacterized protein n=1 Tax=Melanomma pulvis-pyrius CBS 109.77 TaxID=1314802 RepID=A0A6A6X0S1_9PLEO|nr:hypothetical protein K505DRAFT_365296 [Melanomma pulvis-pyrius CBS 109.77]
MSTPVSTHFSESTAQHNFSSTYDQEDPMQAMSSYARIMHEHTKAQLSTATNSARRLSQASDSISSNSTSSAGVTPI